MTLKVSNKRNYITISELVEEQKKIWMRTKRTFCWKNYYALADSHYPEYTHE